MKQKLFTLLTLLVLCVTGAWAVDETLFSMSVKTSVDSEVETDATAAEAGTPKAYALTSYADFGVDGTSAVFYKTSDQGTNKAKYIAKSSTCWFSIQNGGNKVYYQINLTKALAVGDVISFDVKDTKNEKKFGLLFHKDAGQTSGVGSYVAGTNSGSTSPLSYTIKTGDNLIGQTTIYFTRADATSTNFNNLTITRPAPSGPEISVQPVSANYATGTAATALSVTATGTGTLYYQWFSNTSATTEGAVSVKAKSSAAGAEEYTPSTVSAGTTYYYCAVTDDNGTTNSSFATIEVADAAAPTISVSASATEVTAGTSITLTATKNGVPTPTLKWYISDTNSTSAGSEITGETADTYTFEAIAGTKYYYAKAFNSEAPEGVASNIITITAAARTGCNLNQVVFSNGFDAFITDPVGAVHGTIKAYYLSGSSAPTITSTNKSGGSEYTLEGNTFTLTSEDGNTTKVYDVTIETVEPYTEDGMTFNGTETWIKTGNAFSESKKGWVFSKNDNDWTRETPGKNRIYFFLGANTSVTFTQGVSRAIKVYKNGSYVADKTGTFTVDGESSPYMLAIVSNQTSGDGSYKSISVTGAATTVTSVNITPAKEYITYVPTHDLDFTSATELTAYIATAATASTVTMASVDKVPAGTPIVIKATAIGSPIAVSKAASTDDVSDNKLKIGDGFTSIGGDGKYDYILSSGKFYHASAGVLPAGKCYLHLDAAPEANELTMDFGDGDVTGINSVLGSELKVNGYFDLQGRQVAQPTKGLYIVNGRKVIIK